VPPSSCRSFPVFGREKTDVAAAYGGVMMAMMLAHMGTASSVALANGEGGETGNERTVFVVARAVVNTQKQADCSVCGPA
jgi:hypothetical protein